MTGYLVSVLMGVPPTRFTVTVPGLEVRTMLLVMVLALLLSLVMIRIEKELPKEMRPK